MYVCVIVFGIRLEFHFVFNLNLMCSCSNMLLGLSYFHAVFISLSMVILVKSDSCLYPLYMFGGLHFSVLIIDLENCLYRCFEHSH